MWITFTLSGGLTILRTHPRGAGYSVFNVGGSDIVKARGLDAILGPLSRPVGVKQLPGPSLPKLMAQFNPDVDSGIIRISQIIDRVCPHRSCY